MSTLMFELRGQWSGMEEIRFMRGVINEIFKIMIANIPSKDDPR